MASRPEIKVKKSNLKNASGSAQPEREEGGRQLSASGRPADQGVLHDRGAAEAAGLIIKKGHPVVQVSIYNSAEGVNKIIELPK